MTKTYKAPEGKVYDWAVPHTGKIIDLDRTEIPTVEHLYAKVLNLSSGCSIDDYKLVPETDNMKEVEVLYNAKAAKEENI